MGAHGDHFSLKALRCHAGPRQDKKLKKIAEFADPYQEEDCPEIMMGLLERLGLLGRGELVLYAAYALMAGAAYLVARMIVRDEDLRAAQENLEDKDRKQASDPLVRITRPFFSQYVVPSLVRGRKIWDN